MTVQSVLVIYQLVQNKKKHGEYINLKYSSLPASGTLEGASVLHRGVEVEEV